MTIETTLPINSEAEMSISKTQPPSLTELAKKDPELKEMIELIAQFKLRSQAVYLINRKIMQEEIKKPGFGR